VVVVDVGTVTVGGGALVVVDDRRSPLVVVEAAVVTEACGPLGLVVDANVPPGSFSDEPHPVATTTTTAATAGVHH